MKLSSAKKLIYTTMVILSAFQFTSAQTFKISPNGTATLCLGDTLTVEATSGFSRYSWTTKETTRIIKVTQTGRYVCSAYDKAGKMYSDTLDVKTLTPTKPKLSYNPSTQIVCLGDSLVIEIANKFKSIRWSNGSTATRLVLYPKTSDSITLTTIDVNGCKLQTKVYYAVKNCSSSCPKLISAWPDSVLCGSNDSVVLEAKSGYAKYLWSDGDQNRVKTIKKSGTYLLVVQDKSGNICYDTIRIVGGNSRLSITAKHTEICKGDSVQLIATEGFKSYKWNTGSNDRKIWVKPSTTTSYWVSGKDSFGCEHKEDIKITVKTCDDCDNLLGTSKHVLCGEHDSLLIEGKSGFKSYHWNTGSNDRIIKVKKKGWYVLTAVTTSGKECKDSIYVSMGGKVLKAYSNPNPPVVCPGDKVVIEVTNGFSSYWWNTGQRSDRAVLYLKETKEIVIEATDSFGCEARVKIKVTVKDTCNKSKCPEIIKAWPKTNICSSKDSINLEAKSGYSAYQWSTGSKDRSIWVYKAGKYILSFKDSSGHECHDTIKITEGSNKKLGLQVYPGKPYCIGDTVYVKASEGFKTYAWNIRKTTDRIIELVLKERIKIVVEATDSFGCEARTELVIEPDSCNSGIVSISKAKMDVYPNPFTDFIQIRSDQLMQSVSVINLEGKELYNQKVTAFKEIINLEFLEAGVYWIQIETMDEVIHLPVLKN